ncbi:hypothetical protein [Thalassotalea sp. G20_0]|nr:hypothetical protein [Thalassotalea sp. G20_0]
MILIVNEVITEFGVRGEAVMWPGGADRGMVADSYRLKYNA